MGSGAKASPPLGQKSGGLAFFGRSIKRRAPFNHRLAKRHISDKPAKLGPAEPLSFFCSFSLAGRFLPRLSRILGAIGKISLLYQPFCADIGSTISGPALPEAKVLD